MIIEDKPHMNYPVREGRQGAGGIYYSLSSWGAKELLGVSQPHDGINLGYSKT